MGLTPTQSAIISKAQSIGGGDLGVTLGDDACMYLVATIVHDLHLFPKFPEISPGFPDFFSPIAPEKLVIKGDFLALFERLLKLKPEAETYFSCLAALQKSRLKYYKILERQPIPTMDQVGPRSLLQYGQMSNKTLAAFLQWRKWLFDIDNRAGQETGYLFEPIIAHAIGGVPASAKKSPVKRTSDRRKGRQVDCIRGKFAYEIKLRVTIAASGQGRWKEELEFPVDCRKSGYTPVLVVLDPTKNPKLTELRKAFHAKKGMTYVGDEAWKHLDETAGPTMARFIENYVRKPIDQVLTSTDVSPPAISMSIDATEFAFTIDGETVTYPRKPGAIDSNGVDPLPDDVDDELPGA